MEKIDFNEFDAKVDKFLRHQMTLEEEQSFKLELSLDPEKKERARITALMVKMMQQEGLKYDHNIIETIRGIDERQFRKAVGLKPQVVKLWPRIIKYSAAACIVGSILFGGYRYNEYNRTVSLGNSQYLAYVSDISEMASVRGTTDTADRSNMEDLFANVKEGVEIKRTIDELESLYEESFKENSIYNELQDDISWNLAIAYLKSGDRKKPIPILEGMVERNIDYPQISQPAQKLIEQIKEL